MSDQLPTDRDHLWTSAEAATAFRVGVSSIKRWTDEGELESVRTPGGHRRYTLEELHRFASIRRLPKQHLPPLEDRVLRTLPPPADETLFSALRDGDADAVRRLVTPPVQGLSRRAAFLDRVVGDALREVGEGWERGTLGIDEEHRASHLVAEAVDLLRPPVPSHGPLALLACPPDEWHDLPLRLVRLMLEWSGWRTELCGAALPWPSTRAAIDRWKPQMVAFSARSFHPFAYPSFDDLVAFCRSRGAEVVVGGEWARGGTGEVGGYRRFRTLRGFERWLSSREMKRSA